MTTKMELASLAKVERVWHCPYCDEDFPIVGCGTAYIHRKCGRLITKEEQDKK